MANAFGQTLSRAGRLARIATAGPGAWLNFILFGVVLGLSFIGIWFSVQMITWNKAFYDALEKLDAPEATRQIGVFLILTACTASIFLAGDWFTKKLTIRLRDRLTAYTLDLWLGSKAYWLMRPGFATTPIENPDQRVADDCRQFTESFLALTLELISNIVSLFSYVALLWAVASFALSFTAFGYAIEIPYYMVWLSPVYVLISSLVTHQLGRPLKRRFFEREKVEADFRHSLIQLRDGADAVAQSGGEAAVRRRIDSRFHAIRGNWMQLMRAELVHGLFARPYSQTVLRAPTFFALPAYFAGAVTLGGLMQTANAFSSVTTTLSWFIFRYKKLAEFVAVCERLDGLLQATAAPAPMPGAPRAIRRSVAQDGAVELQGVRLCTPDGRMLDPVPDHAVASGDIFLITGASGHGKTTLLAAIAGLWPWGEGHIARPAGRYMFLPAGAPLLGTDLATAACHPEDPASHDPARVAGVLRRLGLDHRLRVAGEEATLAGLSMGERQRLGLARAVLNRPDWLLLDEATSALDSAAEADLLAWLRTELPATTMIVVAHRIPAGLVADSHLHLGPDPDKRTTA